MSENVLGILTLVGFAGAGLVGVSIMALLNRRHKVKTVDAKIVSKEIDNPGITCQAGMPKMFVKFAYKDGDKDKVVRYKVSEKCYSKLPEKKNGTLVYRGSELISFTSGNSLIEFN